MAFYVYERLGAQARYGDDADIDSVVADLLEQLGEDPADREYAEVSVHHGDWYVAAHVSGVLRLGQSPGGAAGRRRKRIAAVYRRAARKAEVVRLLRLMAGGDVEAVQKAGWVSEEQLPTAVKDLFR
ncbi:hypothetical protein [Limnoglobus roseus]|uniref:Uncharacterized protein n=1 Tax=Limnoglobus roseus TaxID=2598579 RepID=A0A5C1ANP7_9BACT|nr:hypothetical protein [Limnoglobus roseus]QEL20195.1 hypothetical protein PX52LOC_07284 [Limnoglobus roseus]